MKTYKEIVKEYMEGKYKDDEKFIVEMMFDARDELCIKCERYRQEHLGACDGCKWKV